MNTKTIKDWELEKGIEIKDKSIKRERKCKEKYFKKLIKTSYISVKTEKGLEYLNEIK